MHGTTEILFKKHFQLHDIDLIIISRHLDEQFNILKQCTLVIVWKIIYNLLKMMPFKISLKGY